MGKLEGDAFDRGAVFCKSAIARWSAWRRGASLSGVISVGDEGDSDGNGAVCPVVEPGGRPGNRLTNTLNSFLSESSLRPPSGVPVMPKYTVLADCGGNTPGASLMDW